MTDRKDALIELLAKVEAGEWHNDGTSWLFGNDWPNVHGAFHGSLDAAKALHEAVLPEWHINLTFDFCSVFPSGNDGEQLAHTGQCNENPARAWLIAILKALIAGENTTYQPRSKNQ
jgi:hypothetical protein